MAFLTQEQLDALAQFDTPPICNAIEGFGVRGRTEGFTRPELRMRAAMSDKPMVGYARTGVISARQPATPAHSAVMEAYYRQYEDFDLPMVAAIQDLDRVPVGSFWGDVQATVHRALGCIGVITDGGVRDIEEVKRVGFYLFSKEVLISHAYIHMVEAGTAVDICGMTVRPGDLIHADAHGAIVIPQEIAGVFRVSVQNDDVHFIPPVCVSPGPCGPGDSRFHWKVSRIAAVPAGRRTWRPDPRSPAQWRG